jgi:cell division protein FtsA
MSFKVSTIFEYDSFIALDIGAFKIKALVCRVENGELKIIGQASTRQSRKDMLQGEISDLRSVADAVAKTIYKATESLENVPNDVIVGINTPYFLYDATSMNYVRQDSSLPISMGEIDDIIAGTEHKSLDRLRSKIDTRVGLVDSEMKPVTTSLTAIYLDGQKVSNPVGFTGKNIKLNLMNIFVPVTKFNIIRNIVSSLEKNIVSIIPIPVSLPKLLERTSYFEESNLFIDIGYSKTTIVMQNTGETKGVHVLPIGTSLLEDMLHKEGHRSYLDIEQLLVDFSVCHKKHPTIVDTFLALLADASFVAVRDITDQVYFKNIFVSGASTAPVLQKYFTSFYASKQ